MRRGEVGLYFVPCFICGSEQEDCGHREPDLVVWWRMKPKTRKSPERGFKARTAVSGGTEPHPETVNATGADVASTAAIQAADSTGKINPETPASEITQVEIPDNATDRVENITRKLATSLFSTGNEGSKRVLDHLGAGFRSAERSELWGM